MEKRLHALFLSILVAFGVACILFSSLTVVRAFPPSQRSWVTVDVPYYAENDILITMTAVTPGNNLNQSLWIEEIQYSNSSSGFPILSVTVAVGSAVVEAEYSADTNTTTFTYTLSSTQYGIKPHGQFPYDKWDISIVFATSLNVTFDPRLKYCLTPSNNYYGSYTTTAVSGKEDWYSLNLEILHPSSFPNYVFMVFLVPAILMFIPGAVLAAIAIKRRKIFNEFFSGFIAICSAVIVFIPIFELSTQGLKTPLAFNWFDALFLALLSFYIVLLGGLLIAKYWIARKPSSKTEQIRGVVEQNPEGEQENQQIMVPDDKKEAKNDIEKLIDWEQNKQLTWAVVFLTSVLGLAGLFVANPFSIGKEVVAVILSLFLTFLVNLSFYRLATSLVFLRHHIERLGQISHLYSQELVDKAIFKGLYGFFVDETNKENPRLRKNTVIGVLFFVDALLVAMILGIVRLL